VREVALDLDAPEVEEIRSLLFANRFDHAADVLARFKRQTLPLSVY
jgi:hypothetical protein